MDILQCCDGVATLTVAASSGAWLLPPWPQQLRKLLVSPACSRMTLAMHTGLSQHQQHMCLQVEDVKFEQAPTIADCYPSSEKVHRIVEHANGPLEVPFRRIHLEGGSEYLDVPDTSGPQVQHWHALQLATVTLAPLQRRMINLVPLQSQHLGHYQLCLFMQLNASPMIPTSQCI